MAILSDRKLQLHSTILEVTNVSRELSVTESMSHKSNTKKNT